ncbi:MAG: mannose-1-phosphate guanylyltransferase/mannose-6-phosphate isomerase [Rhodospirillaceae bacterium]|nr:mannose-1-phosphate guanylyltransferase/mannose-6-phosphate isomerase [Rhodospirillales bacterium]
MAAPQIVPVILSGGAGTRLWPLSREHNPKQFQHFGSDRTLLQETAARFPAPPLVVCNNEHRFLVTEQLRHMGITPQAIVVEPVGRGTAAAAAFAAIMLERSPGALMLVMPSDHSIADQNAFRRAVDDAVELAQAGQLVTFGVRPAEAHTGYGYIRRGAPAGNGFLVERFVEKPDATTAARFLAAGDYDWNSGIFLFSAALWLDELARRQPAMVESCRRAIAQGQGDLGFLRLDEDSVRQMATLSIDHAVMEKTDRAAMMPVEMGWSDVGSWSSVWRMGGPDDQGNVITGDVTAMDSTDCYLRSDKGLLATVGVDNLVVVAMGDAVLVAHKSRDQDIKLAVETLKAAGRNEAIHGARVLRPWGWFESLATGPRFQVKLIQVEPGGRLSLQKHWHRSEHWVVVTGTAVVTCGEEVLVLRENQSTYIQAGTIHRLENPGRFPLQIIEVQSGEYVGEDDIVRIEDTYGR